MTSTQSSPSNQADVCANCNVSACATLAAGDGGAVVLLKNCSACLLVKYCSVDCQRAHRSKHKTACKKRAAELKEERLYGQGRERPEGDFCLICALPIPLPVDDHSVFNMCCMKKVCDGCAIAGQLRGMGDNCEFCRTPVPSDNEAALAMVRKRADVGDSDALDYLGWEYFYGGEHGLEKDVQRAIELWAEAADLGSMEAHFQLGNKYCSGDGVEKDKAKGIFHWQEAANKGHAQSRHKLGVVESNADNWNLALKHFLISAKMGYKCSLDAIRLMFAHGHATKAQYADALKGYQDAFEETKSPERDFARAVEAIREKIPSGWDTHS